MSELIQLKSLVSIANDDTLTEDLRNNAKEEIAKLISTNPTLAKRISNAAVNSATKISAVDIIKQIGIGIAIGVGVNYIVKTWLADE